jgi:hypothetical protein
MRTHHGESAPADSAHADSASAHLRTPEPDGADAESAPEPAAPAASAHADDTDTAADAELAAEILRRWPRMQTAPEIVAAILEVSRTLPTNAHTAIVKRMGEQGVTIHHSVVKKILDTRDEIHTDRDTEHNNVVTLHR